MSIAGDNSSASCPRSCGVINREAVVNFSVVVELNPLSAINVPGLQHDVEKPVRDFLFVVLVFVAKEPSGFTPPITMTPVVKFAKVNASWYVFS